MTTTTTTTNPRSRRSWMNQVKLANNANFIGFELNILGQTEMVFEATPFAADGILKAINKAHQRTNELIVMTTEKVMGHGNIYAIVRVIG